MAAAEGEEDELDTESDAATAATAAVATLRICSTARCSSTFFSAEVGR